MNGLGGRVRSVVLSETEGLSLGPAAVGAAMVGQRERLVEVLAGLPPDDWTGPTRCERWNVADIARHVTDTAEIVTGTLAGRPDPRLSAHRFDATADPDEWLRARGDGGRALILDGLVRAVRHEREAFERRLAHGPDDVVDGPSRRRQHWSVFAVHMLWDSWLHERDVVVPRGYEQASADVEKEIVPLYGLLVAATRTVRDAEQAHFVVEMEGAAAPRHEIFATRPDIRVVNGSVEVVDVRGRWDDVLDSLAGRGPSLDLVLHGRARDIDALSALRSFFRSSLGGPRTPRGPTTGNGIPATMPPQL